MDPLNILIVVVILPAALVIGTLLRSSGRQRDSVPPRGRIMPPDGNLERAVRGLLRGPRPQKITAIKVVRERTGMRLKDAKGYVDTIERGAAPGAGMDARSDEDPQHVAEGVVRAVQGESGTKIEAIKRVRTVTGMGLKDAKNFVDAHWGLKALVSQRNWAPLLQWAEVARHLDQVAVRRRRAGCAQAIVAYLDESWS